MRCWASGSRRAIGSRCSPTTASNGWSCTSRWRAPDWSRCRSTSGSSRPEIEYIATHCEARAFVVQDELIDRVEPIRDRLDIGRERFIHFGAARRARRAGSPYEALISSAAATAPAIDVLPAGHLGADVHVGHDRQAQGCDPQPCRQRAHLARDGARHGLDARRHRAAGDADVPRELAVLLLHVHAPRRHLRDRRPQELRPRASAADARRAAGDVHVARADALHHDARPAARRRSASTTCRASAS